MRDTASSSVPDSGLADPDRDNYAPEDWEDVEIEVEDALGWVFEVSFSAEQAQQLFAAIRDGQEDAVAFIRRTALEAAASQTRDKSTAPALGSEVG
ncbi:MAG: hypothetical protein F4Y04_06990 [Chloroflexi bacterium]|nr:hypothetical protein [Chloroflexota bacterium]